MSALSAFCTKRARKVDVAPRAVAKPFKISMELTPREMEVAELCSLRLDKVRMAEHLCLSFHSVRLYVDVISRKTGIGRSESSDRKIDLIGDAFHRSQFMPKPSKSDKQIS